jgi:hypothetical protein
VEEWHTQVGGKAANRLPSRDLKDKQERPLGCWPRSPGSIIAQKTASAARNDEPSAKRRVSAFRVRWRYDHIHRWRHDNIH